MITKQDLLNTREQIQEDLDCIFDGIEDYNRILTNANQTVVDRFKVLFSKLKEKKNVK